MGNMMRNMTGNMMGNVMPAPHFCSECVGNVNIIALVTSILQGPLPVPVLAWVDHGIGVNVHGVRRNLVYMNDSPRHNCLQNIAVKTRVNLFVC